MLVILYIIAFVAFTIYSKHFRYFWKKHTAATYWLSFLLAMVLAVSAEMAGYPDGWFYDQCIALAGTLILAFPLPLIYRGKRKDDRDYQALEELFSQPKSYLNTASPRKTKNAPSAASVLPKSTKRRARIAAKFSREFDLNLTESEIDTIVSASFVSPIWAAELSAMDRKYDNPTEWYKGPTHWLRIYMKAFTIQNVTYDIEIQREIVINSLDDIFNYVDQHSFSNLGQCIEAVNRNYFTNFDDMTFMLSYRFLEANGHRHTLPRTQILKSSEAEMDELTQKYLQ